MKLLVFALLFCPVTYGQDVWHHGCSCGPDPEFPGGIKAFHKYLQEHLDFTGIPGVHENYQRLYVTFRVTEFGDVSSLTIHRNGESKVLEETNKEVIREIEDAFYNMPIWTQGRSSCSSSNDFLVRIPIQIDWRDQQGKE